METDAHAKTQVHETRWSVDYITPSLEWRKQQYGVCRKAVQVLSSSACSYETFQKHDRTERNNDLIKYGLCPLLVIGHIVPDICTSIQKASAIKWIISGATTESDSRVWLAAYSFPTCFCTQRSNYYYIILTFKYVVGLYSGKTITSALYTNSRLEQTMQAFIENKMECIRGKKSFENLSCANSKKAWNFSAHTGASKVLHGAFTHHFNSVSLSIQHQLLSRNNFYILGISDVNSASCCYTVWKVFLSDNIFSPVTDLDIVYRLQSKMSVRTFHIWSFSMHFGWTLLFCIRNDFLFYCWVCLFSEQAHYV